MGELIGMTGMTTYERIMDVLADGKWHSIEELQKVSAYPYRWLEELRRDGLWVIEDEATGIVALAGSMN